MKKIMHLMSTSVFSGAENVACQIINNFADEDGYEMKYVSVIGDNKKSLIDRDISYINLNKFNYFSVKKAIGIYRPDIIHAHDIRASIMAALCSNHVITIISHIHSNHLNMRTLNLKTILYSLSCKRYTKIVWVSNSAIKDYKYKNNIINKSIVLYNTVNLNEIKDKILKDNKLYNYDLIYLGRLISIKDPVRLIRIIEGVADQKKDLKVAIIGNGSLEQELKRLISLKKLNSNIDLYGFVLNPYKILSSSKIMIMTSVYEGTPMCALEAIALGKPIVSTPTDGLIDLVKDGKTGFLSKKDEVLIDKILLLLENKELYRQISENVSKESIKINDVAEFKRIIKSLY